MSKILLIEDDEYTADIFSSILNESGFPTTVARDGLAGLEEAKKSHYDLILLDIMMPKMQGLQVLKNLKQDPTTKDMPVYILSNLNQDDVVAESIKLGASGYLLKVKYLPDELVNKVAEILESLSAS